MKKSDSYNGTLDTELYSLSRRKQLAFSLLLFERMMPLLEAFSQRTGFDDSIYHRGRTAAWDSLREESDTSSRVMEWRHLASQCLKLAPDTEQYTDEFVSYALNAAICLSAVLEFLTDRKTSHLLEIRQSARDSVDAFLENTDMSPVSAPGTARLDAHPLMKRENERQYQDVQFLSSLPEKFEISSLRRRSRNQKTIVPITDIRPR
jgi:uncharacterized protein YjaG (DUF416 family)